MLMSTVKASNQNARIYGIRTLETANRELFRKMQIIIKWLQSEYLKL